MDMNEQRKLAESTQLGKAVDYPTQYSPELLIAIPRADNRDNLHLGDSLPFDGVDIWNAYELSWLDAKGKPQVAVAEFYVPCQSSNVIESKSFKLYLNSFYQTTIESKEALQQILQADLSKAAGKGVRTKVIEPSLYQQVSCKTDNAICIDDLDIDVTEYDVNPELLSCERSGPVQEYLYSTLFRSNCPVTGQPDWATVFIRYEGRPISHAGLLRYLISYRQHNAFHEHCIERIYVDIMDKCAPSQLTVYGRFTRRGGLDINPFRSNFELSPHNYKTFRQ